MRTRRFGILAVLLLAGCRVPDAAPPAEGYRIVRTFRHDPTAYTQGLVLADTIMYESTGLYGHSDVRIVDPASGTVLKSVPMAKEQFGEGLTLLAGRLYQLTWRAEVGYVYDALTLAPVDSFRYQGEGWGLATDGTSLIMSDGSDTLRFLTPGTFAVARRLPVSFSTGAPATRLNELEYIDGEIFANVYQSDWIVRIDPNTGAVREVLDLGALPERAKEQHPGDEVLNGIAFDRRTGHLLVTGKHWATLFELALTNPPGVKP
ncbi:MAG TPA: glutaminyl-peptide cyclotransferase [Gemmatimonadales bacterium]|nr:glutaminyl-peptide cyclotransferase [Gemmatimonadales bacterium]